jgi:hypothetical protein
LNYFQIFLGVRWKKNENLLQAQGQAKNEKVLQAQGQGQSKGDAGITRVSIHVGMNDRKMKTSPQELEQRISKLEAKHLQERSVGGRAKHITDSSAISTKCLQLKERVGKASQSLNTTPHDTPHDKTKQNH